MRKRVDPIAEEEAYKLFLLINQTADGLRKLRQRSLETCGITMEQAAALICIKNLGGRATSSELSKWLFREPNTITALVNGMEKRGLLVRVPSEENKKIKYLQLTQRGEETLEESSNLEFLHSTILQLSPAKRKQFKTTLEMLREKTFATLLLDVNDYIHLRDVKIDFSQKNE